MKSLQAGLMLILLSALPVQAGDIQNLQNRLDKATQKPEQQLGQQAEKLTCKGQKKPICYADGVVIEARFALVKISRPEQGALFLLFEKIGEQWKLRHAGKIVDLKPATLTLKAEISQKHAQALIQKLAAVR